MHGPQQLLLDGLFSEPGYESLHEVATSVLDSGDSDTARNEQNQKNAAGQVLVVVVSGRWNRESSSLSKCASLWPSDGMG
jgi:hypothetical protein